MQVSLFSLKKCSFAKLKIQYSQKYEKSYFNQLYYFIFSTDFMQFRNQYKFSFK